MEIITLVANGIETSNSDMEAIWSSTKFDEIPTQKGKMWYRFFKTVLWICEENKMMQGS